MQARRIKKGDTVEVIAGKEKGKTGRVMKVVGDENRVVVEKVNFIKKHSRPDAKGKGGIVEKEGAIAMSNVMRICEKCKSAARIGFKILEDGKKVRTCRKCSEVLDE